MYAVCLSLCLCQSARLGYARLGYVVLCFGQLVYQVAACYAMPWFPVYATS